VVVGFALPYGKAERRMCFGEGGDVYWMCLGEGGDMLPDVYWMCAGCARMCSDVLGCVRMCPGCAPDVPRMGSVTAKK
jgi:hypothetical protein